MLTLDALPLDTPYVSQRTQLSGIPFLVSWAFNARTDSWTISLAAMGDGSEAPTPVLSGAKVFIGYDLMRRCRHPLRPPGRLYAYSTDGGYEHPTMNELGSRVKVIYLEPGERLSG